MKKKILITGGAGFIGSYTADALAKQGYGIRILDNLKPPVHNGRWPAYVLRKGYELVRGDVRKKGDWLRVLKGIHAVYHLAAHQDQLPDFSTFFHVNTVGTALLYELAVAKQLPIRKVILASSQFVYGDGRYRCEHAQKFFYPELRAIDDLRRERFDILCAHGKRAQFYPFREDQLLTPTNSYGLSKHALEELAFRLGKTYNIPTVALRYSIVQGPRQSPRNLYSGALRIFVTQALQGKLITVYEDGMQMRDFVNIRDVVAANLIALRSKKMNFNVFNVGGGRGYRVLDFAKLVQTITRSRSPIAVGGFRRTDTRHAISDISKLRRLGWRPRYTPEDSVRDYVRWYRENFS